MIYLWLGLVLLAYGCSWSVLYHCSRAVRSFSRLRSFPAVVVGLMRQELIRDWPLSLLLPFWAFRVRRRVLLTLRKSWAEELKRQMRVEDLYGDDRTFRQVIEGLCSLSKMASDDRTRR